VLVLELNDSISGDVVGRAMVEVSLCRRCERYIRSAELTHGRAVQDLRGWEVTRALVPPVLVLLKRMVRNQWRLRGNLRLLQSSVIA